MAEAPYNQTRTGPEGGSDYRTGTTSTPNAQRLGQQPTTEGGQTTRNFGQFRTNDYDSFISAALTNPETAAMVLRLALGQSGRPKGRLADFRDNLRGNAFNTAMNLAGAPGFGSLEEMAPEFLQAILDNNLLGYTSGLGNTIAGMDFGGMDSTDIDKFLKAGLALQGMNMGGLGRSVRQGQLDDLIWDDLVNALGSGEDDNTGFVQALANSPFRQAMSTFGR